MLDMKKIAFATAISAACLTMTACSQSTDGASQSASSQTADTAAATTTADGKKAQAQKNGGNCHTHPRTAGSTTTRHCHPHAGSRAHTHKTQRIDPWEHIHAAIPNCTKSFRHSHKFAGGPSRGTNVKHSHKYTCTGRGRGQARSAGRRSNDPIRQYMMSQR